MIVAEDNDHKEQQEPRNEVDTISQGEELGENCR